MKTNACTQLAAALSTKRLWLVLLIALYALPLASFAEQDKVQLMFVQIADDLKADGKTLRLVNVGKQTLYFSDRPERIAGHIKMDAYMEEWTPRAGTDNFANNPPNAVLSVYEPGKNENTITVVEISHPVIDGSDLVYDYKLIEGSIPDSGGVVALFIDRIGVGGGVGVGYHGVGVGARGPGVR